MLCTRIVKLLKSLYLLHFKLSLQTESEHANAKSALTKSDEKMAKLYLYANFTFVAFFQLLLSAALLATRKTRGYLNFLFYLLQMTVFVRNSKQAAMPSQPLNFLMC